MGFTKKNKKECTCIVRQLDGETKHHDLNNEVEGLCTCHLKRNVTNLFEILINFHA